MWPDGSGPTLIVDDGGDATLLVHKGVEFEKAGKVPGVRPGDNEPEEWGVILDLLRKELNENPNRWTKVAAGPARRQRRDDHGRAPSLPDDGKPARCCSRPSTSTTR